MKCCICGKEIKGYGNNPEGYTDPKTLKLKEWNPDDRCCDDCNNTSVIDGRITIMEVRSKIVSLLPKKNYEASLERLRTFVDNGVIEPATYKFILANWDILTR